MYLILIVAAVVVSVIAVRAVQRAKKRKFDRLREMSVSGKASYIPPHISRRTPRTDVSNHIHISAANTRHPELYGMQKTDGMMALMHYNNMQEMCNNTPKQPNI